MTKHWIDGQKVFIYQVSWSKTFWDLKMVQRIIMSRSTSRIMSRSTSRSTSRSMSLSPIKSDALDRENIQKFLATCIHAFSIEEHQTDIVNIHSGKLSTKEVNVDSCVSIGKQQVQRFIAALPNGL